MADSDEGWAALRTKSKDRALVVVAVVGAAVFGFLGFLDAAPTPSWLACASGCAITRTFGWLSVNLRWLGYGDVAFGSFVVATVCFSLHWRSFAKSLALFSAPALMLFELYMWQGGDGGAWTHNMPMFATDFVSGMVWGKGSPIRPPTYIFSNGTVLLVSSLLVLTLTVRYLRKPLAFVCSLLSCALASMGTLFELGYFTYSNLPPEFARAAGYWQPSQEVLWTSFMLLFAGFITLSVLWRRHDVLSFSERLWCLVAGKNRAL
ncbi:MAG: hypothetical protein ACLP9K_08900 [Nitrososphaerales archaeon]|jgi:hypothetical protein